MKKYINCIVICVSMFFIFYKSIPVNAATITAMSVPNAFGGYTTTYNMQPSARPMTYAEFAAGAMAYANRKYAEQNKERWQQAIANPQLSTISNTSNINLSFVINQISFSLNKDNTIAIVNYPFVVQNNSDVPWYPDSFMLTDSAGNAYITTSMEMGKIVIAPHTAQTIGVQFSVPYNQFGYLNSVVLTQGAFNATPEVVNDFNTLNLEQIVAKYGLASNTWKICTSSMLY